MKSPLGCGFFFIFFVFIFFIFFFFQSKRKSRDLHSEFRRPVHSNGHLDDGVHLTARARGTHGVSIKPDETSEREKKTGPTAVACRVRPILRFVGPFICLGDQSPLLSCTCSLHLPTLLLPPTCRGGVYAYICICGVISAVCRTVYAVGLFHFLV